MSLEFIKPQLATAVDHPPPRAGWIHEVKHDGYRTLLIIERRKARAYTRNGFDWTALVSISPRNGCGGVGRYLPSMVVVAPGAPGTPVVSCASASDVSASPARSGNVNKNGCLTMNASRVDRTCHWLILRLYKAFSTV